MPSNTFKSANALQTRDMNPEVLYCSFFPGNSFTKGMSLGKRFVYDYEIEYFSEGTEEGYILINDTPYPVKQGDIMLRKPGMTAEGVMPYSGYTICFDPGGERRVKPEEYWDTRHRRFLNPFDNDVLEAIPIRVSLSNEKLLPLFQSTYHEFNQPGTLSPLIVKANLLNILAQVFSGLHQDYSVHALGSSAYYSRLKRVIEFICVNCDKPLSLQELAKLADLSPNYFHTVFTQSTGKTLTAFITDIRINKAKELLLNTNLKVNLIAEKCGFSTASYFTSVFRKKCSMSPVIFRDLSREKEG